MPSRWVRDPHAQAVRSDLSSAAWGEGGPEPLGWSRRRLVREGGVDSPSQGRQDFPRKHGVVAALPKGCWSYGGSAAVANDRN